MKPLKLNTVRGVMWKNGVLLFFLFSASFALKAQLKNSYIVTDNQEFDRVKFSLNATNGQCLIESSSEAALMDIHSNTEESIQPQYEEQIINRTKEVKVELGEKHSTSLSTTISKHMFSTQAVDDYTWNPFFPTPFFR